MTVVEMEAARAEDARREVELRAPVVDDRAGRRIAGPTRSSRRRPASAARMNTVVAGEGELEVALVVERHRVDLPERVLAVEHPAVGAREQRVGDVADALAGARAAGSPGRCPESTAAGGRRGISLPSNRPALASRTRMVVPADGGVGLRNARGSRSRGGARRRSMRARIRCRRSASNDASAATASSAAGVSTSGYRSRKSSRTCRLPTVRMGGTLPRSEKGQGQEVQSYKVPTEDDVCSQASRPKTSRPEPVRLRGAERYRSGRNGGASKASCPKGHVGSNPTLSAINISLVVRCLPHQTPLLRTRFVRCPRCPISRSHPLVHRCSRTARPCSAPHVPDTKTSTFPSV